MAHRLFGPQPHTSTYTCIWEIGVGSLKGALAPSEARVITKALSSFYLNFKDELNAPAEEFMPPTEPDGKYRQFFKSFLFLRLSQSRF